MSNRFIGFLAIVLIVILSVRSFAFPPGNLDLTFDGDGMVTTPISIGTPGHDNDLAWGVAMQSDGKIVVAGTVNEGGDTTRTDFALVRYNSNGSLDTTFDGDGIVTTNLGGMAGDRGQALAIQSDGKIVVAGIIHNFSNIFMAVVRYNANGSLDTTFNGNGVATTQIDLYHDIYSMVIQPDGKIVVAGSSSTELSNPKFALVRYNTNGSLDTTFDGDGKVTTQIGTANSTINSVALQSDGKIVAAGYTVAGIVLGDVALARYNTNGSLDTTFDGDGKVTTPIGSFGDQANGVAIQSDGKIIAAGFTHNNSSGSSEDLAMARYNANGSLDTTFDSDGKITTSTTGLDEELKAVIIQPNGKIVAVGFTNPGINYDSLVARYNSNGSLDSTFNFTGIVTIPTVSTSEQFWAVAIQPNGNIVAAGYTVLGSNDFFVARFLGDTRSPVFDFDGDGKTDISIFRPSVGEWWINRSSSGQIVAAQFGQSIDKITPADYTGDGKTDFAFFRPSSGQWFVLRSEDFSFFAFPFGVGTDVPVPADYDGDGKADAAVFRPSTNTWFIQKSSGGTDIIGFGTSGDKPVVGDYDGDGKADIAIFRPNGANGAEWWIRRSSNQSVFALQFGASTDKAVQGDYTGDGKTDVAFWRPSNGNWFILRSEDFSFFAFPFGANGDIPVAGDYDGDGKFDAGVFRPTSNTWFIQRSTAGTLIQTFGIAGDLPTPNAFVP